MLNAFSDLLRSKLCCDNRPGPNCKPVTSTQWCRVNGMRLDKMSIYPDHIIVHLTVQSMVQSTIQPGAYKCHFVTLICFCSSLEHYLILMISCFTSATCIYFCYLHFHHYCNFSYHQYQHPHLILLATHFFTIIDNFSHYFS